MAARHMNSNAIEGAESTAGGLLDVSLAGLLRRSPASPNQKVTAALMIKFGLTQKELALELGVTAPRLNRVITGTETSGPLRREIAAFLGIRISDIWPPEITFTHRETANNSKTKEFSA